MANFSVERLKAVTKLRVAENCTLRVLDESDVTSAYVDGLNDPVVGRYLVGSRSERQTEASVRAYVCINRKSDRDMLFGIFIDDGLRGTVRLHDIDAGDCTARVGILLFDRNYWQQGWASKAISAALAFARDNLGVTRFRAGMRQENAGSRRTFEGLGFVYQPSADWVDDVGRTHQFFLLCVADTPAT